MSNVNILGSTESTLLEIPYNLINFLRFTKSIIIFFRKPPYTEEYGQFRAVLKSGLHYSNVHYSGIS